MMDPTTETRLAELEAENADLRARLQEVAETCASDWINLANSSDAFLAENYKLVVRTEDVLDSIREGGQVITTIFHDAWQKALEEKRTLQQAVNRLNKLATHDDPAAWDSHQELVRKITAPLVVT